MARGKRIRKRPERLTFGLGGAFSPRRAENPYKSGQKRTRSSKGGASLVPESADHTRAFATALVTGKTALPPESKRPRKEQRGKGAPVLPSPEGGSTAYLPSIASFSSSENEGASPRPAIEIGADNFMPLSFVQLMLRQFLADFGHSGYIHTCNTCLYVNPLGAYIPVADSAFRRNIARLGRGHMLIAPVNEHDHHFTLVVIFKSDRDQLHALFVDSHRDAPMAYFDAICLDAGVHHKYSLTKAVQINNDCAFFVLEAADACMARIMDLIRAQDSLGLWPTLIEEMVSGFGCASFATKARWSAMVRDQYRTRLSACLGAQPEARAILDVADDPEHLTFGLPQSPSSASSAADSASAYSESEIPSESSEALPTLTAKTKSHKKPKPLTDTEKRLPRGVKALLTPMAEVFADFLNGTYQEPVLRERGRVKDHDEYTPDDETGRRKARQKKHRRRKGSQKAPMRKPTTRSKSRESGVPLSLTLE